MNEKDKATVDLLFEISQNEGERHGKMPDFSKIGASLGDAAKPAADPRFAPKGTTPVPTAAPVRAVPVVPTTSTSVPKRTDTRAPTPVETPTAGESTFNDLVTSVNEPDWVTKLMDEQKKQHRELMAALKPSAPRAGATSR